MHVNARATTVHSLQKRAYCECSARACYSAHTTACLLFQTSKAVELMLLLCLNCTLLLLPDIIMVGTGTGIAPYRGFVRRLFQEDTAAARAYTGQAWLFLGVANRYKNCACIELKLLPLLLSRQ
jgi:Oxidoreductase NAD-binding domain